jgi:hypothetical protein
MPFTPISRTDLSDLVYHELDPSVGYARMDIVVQSASPMKMGTLVFRVKNASALAPYAPVTAATALVATNEFAVAFGDKYSCKETWTAGATDTAINSVAFVSGPIFLKDALILENLGFEPNATQYATMKQLLQNQGIVLEKTL